MVRGIGTSVGQYGVWFRELWARSSLVFVVGPRKVGEFVSSGAPSCGPVDRGAEATGLSEHQVNSRYGPARAHRDGD